MFSQFKFLLSASFLTLQLLSISTTQVSATSILYEVDNSLTSNTNAPKTNIYTSDFVDQQDSSPVITTLEDALSWSNLPDEIWDHIASFVDCSMNLYRVNRTLFSIATNYSLQHVCDKGFEALDKLPQSSRSKIQGRSIDFFKYDSSEVPSYVLYSFIDSSDNFPFHAWPYLKKTKIDKLAFTNFDLNYHKIYQLKSLLPSSNIKELSLKDNAIYDNGLIALCEVLALTQINVLNLTSIEISSSGIKELAATLPKTQIHTLNLSDNDVEDTGAIALAHALPHSKILTLNLFNCHIGSSGITALTQTLSQTKIRQLNLSSNKFDYDLMLAFASALTNSQICNLTLGANSIDDEQCKILAGALPKTKIKHLDLRSNKITDEGANALGEVLLRTNINSLLLFNNNIKEELKFSFMSRFQQIKLFM